MCVHRDPRLAERITQDGVRRLAPHPRQRNQVRHRVRDGTVETSDEFMPQRNQVPRFVVIEPCRADIFFDFLDTRVVQILRAGEPLKQRRCHHIHPTIRTLSRQNRGDDHLIRILKVEFRFSVRIRAVQRAGDSPSTTDLGKRSLGSGHANTIAGAPDITSVW